MPASAMVLMPPFVSQTRHADGIAPEVPAMLEHARAAISRILIPAPPRPFNAAGNLLVATRPPINVEQLMNIVMITMHALLLLVVKMEAVMARIR